MNELRSTTKQRGVTLVETMVAMVVLAIGMLGIAALYVESLRAERTALIRTQAVALASDMADRIRANPTAGANYTKAVTAKGTLNAKCNPGGTGGCTPAEMAANDIAVWHSLVDDDDDSPGSGQVGLPGGQASIAVNGSNPTTYTIQIQWSDAGNGTQSLSLEIQA